MDYRTLIADAEAGSVVAQSVLGISYLSGGDGLPQDHAEAFRWLTAAAIRGASRPSVWLGTMYEQGLTVAPDVEKARALYRFGAERGEFHGRIFLARLLLSGRTGSVDEAGALYWYGEAAEMLGIEECDEREEARTYVRDHT